MQYVTLNSGVEMPQLGFGVFAASSIATLDTGESLFFSHQDPAWVRSLGTRKLDI